MANPEPRQTIAGAIRTFVRSAKDRQRRRHLELMVRRFVAEAEQLGAEDLAHLVWLSGLFWANGNALKAHVALVTAAGSEMAQVLAKRGDGGHGLPRLR